jgi:hypothetical protein
LMILHIKCIRHKSTKKNCFMHNHWHELNGLNIKLRAQKMVLAQQ